MGTAWGLFETLDLVLAGAGLAAVYIGYRTMIGQWRFGGGWLFAIGLVALLIVLSQIIDPPPTVEPAIQPVGFKPPHIGTGAWLALGASAATVVAGLLSIASLSLAVTLDSSSGGGRRRAAADA